jgi:hypothetical protein
MFDIFFVFECIKRVMYQMSYFLMFSDMFLWCHKKLTWLPLLPLAVVMTMLLGTVITYSVAAALRHVSFIFPFIR